MAIINDKKTENPLQRVVALAEILYEHYDHFLTQYKSGEFAEPTPETRADFLRMVVEFALVNERTADLFRQIAQIEAFEVGETDANAECRSLEK